MSTPQQPEASPTPEVSFAEVADEDAEQSVAHEAEATDEVEQAAPGGPDLPDEPLEPGVETVLDNDTPPQQPTVSSMLGVGPVGEDDDLTA